MEFLNSFWSYLQMTAPYLMLGMGMAGLIHIFLSVEKVESHLGKGKPWAIIKASLFGVPLPLCSCSVIPTAIALRKKGASNSATSSFLVSTPETGVDSIAVTYGLMDLPMAVMRPLFAFVTASTVGVVHRLFNEDFEVKEEEKAPCCSKNKKQDKSLLDGIKYGYFTLLEDIAVWLTFGLIAGACIDWFFPAASLEGWNGLWGRVALMTIGTALYICASASTPIAASLILKGMSPGTAMLILLTGPATNLSSILVLQKYLGKKGIILNIIVIMIVSLILSYVVDFLYSSFNWPLTMKLAGHHHHEHTNYFLLAITVVFCLLLVRALFKRLVK
jgi:uncharacterized membrane protein YraQ (UPF0718 family)